MTPIPSRILRPLAECCSTRPPATARDRQRHAYILEAAHNIFVAVGPARVTIREFSDATGIPQCAIRRQVSDMHHLFGLILAKHLDTILAAIGKIPHSLPNIFARRRAEYLRVTRGFCNVPTPLHFLWLRDRFALPADVLDPIEQQARMIGFMLAGEAWDTALTLLDSPTLGLDTIEAMLAAHTKIDELRQIDPDPAPNPITADQISPKPAALNQPQPNPPASKTPSPISLPTQIATQAPRQFQPPGTTHQPLQPSATAPANPSPPSKPEIHPRATPNAGPLIWRNPLHPAAHYPKPPPIPVQPAITTQAA